MRNLPVTAVLAFFVFASPTSADMLLNGSFENNSAGGTRYNMDNAEFNSVIPNATAILSVEIDIMTYGGGFGINPADGCWFIGLANGLGPDSFSFHITGNITAGNTYSLGYWGARNTVFSEGNDVLEIGISDIATEFGTLVHTSSALDADSWTRYSDTFIAPVNASFLTVRISSRVSEATWIHADGFTLREVPEPSTVLVAAPFIGATFLGFRRRRKI